MWFYIYKEMLTFRNICNCVQYQLVKKGCHSFETEKGGVYERVWREEREGGVYLYYNFKIANTVHAQKDMVL